MSKQLAISSAFSIFAMAAFVLFAGKADEDRQSRRSMETGAGYSIAAPIISGQLRKHLLLPFEVG